MTLVASRSHWGCHRTQPWVQLQAHTLSALTELSWVLLQCGLRAWSCFLNRTGTKSMVIKIMIPATIQDGSKFSLGSRKSSWIWSSYSVREWVAIPFSRGSSPPRDQTHSPALAGHSLPLGYQEGPREDTQWCKLTELLSLPLYYCHSAESRLWNRINHPGFMSPEVPAPRAPESCMLCQPLPEPGRWGKLEASLCSDLFNKRYQPAFLFELCLPALGSELAVKVFIFFYTLEWFMWRRNDLFFSWPILLLP